jgi:bifunctional UDP-N-acetylglucosamine pyrophosphorylase / glucosamine-1-phosphate N-acetyltransferase
MTQKPLLTLVLAAGKGTRMRSDSPKVMHAIGGRSMLAHVLDVATSVGSGRTVVVVGPGMEQVATEAKRVAGNVEIAVQAQQRGTADAVLAARAALASHDGDVLVLFGDTPLITQKTLETLKAALASGAQVAVLGFMPEDPTGYGRLLTTADNALTGIREHNDASEAERKIRLCNAGVMAFRIPKLVELLDAIGAGNAKGEYYLTDAVGLAHARGFKIVAVTGDVDEVMGVNARAQLAEAEAIFQSRARSRVMAGGATLIDPGSVWFAYDTVIGRDVIIEPNVFFGPGVVVEDNVIIKANSHIEGADAKSRAGVVIRAGAVIGPFARLRPGTSIGPDVHIGNFVEVKNATLEAGAKANHLAYIGDGRVGEKANIGAGTIFCNYDGYNKHFTDIGAGAFIGSNSSLVAPVKIGAGAYIGSGSVITKNVAADALAIERSAQDERPGWGAKFRAAMQRRKGR